MAGEIVVKIKVSGFLFGKIGTEAEDKEKTTTVPRATTTLPMFA